MTTNHKKNFYVTMHSQTARRILDSAEGLLLAEGFSRVTMSEIARTAGLSRQRVYMYFTNIDQIIYEIQINNMNSFISALAKVLAKPMDSAADSLLKLVDAVFAYEEKHSSDFIFTNEFDAFYRQRRADPALQQRYAQTYGQNELSSRFYLMLKQGQQTGEFRTGFEPDQALVFWYNITQLICERIALFRVNGEGHTASEKQKMIAVYKDALLRYLK